MSEVIDAFLSSLFLVQSWLCLCQSQDASVINRTMDVNTTRPGIEEEILGPLRVWHIVFIVFSLLIAILVVVCCCMDIRVPRTRQEIEYNYDKRLINEKYLHALESSPDQVLQQHREETASKNQRIETISQLIAPKTLPKPINAADRMRKAVQLTSSRAAGTRKRTTEDEETRTGNGHLFKTGIRKPLPVNPRDILALVAQQQKRNAQL